MHRLKKHIVPILLFVILASSIITIINVALPQYSASNNISTYLESIDFNSVINEVNISAIESHVRFFSSFETRSTGYPGFYAAADYIYNKFKEYGLENVTRETFTIPECMDHGANITLHSINETFRIYAMKPNFGVPSTTPPEGITGKLIYVRRGNIQDFDGLPVEGSIVLMDWESGLNWLTAARLGAKAVIFLPPTTIPTYHVPQTIEVPFLFPRFYAPQGHLLLNHLGETVTIRASIYWEKIEAVNIMGFLRGTEYPNRSVLLTAYFDSGSVFPALAPGAEESLGISVLLEVAKWLAKPENRPRYNIIFIAYSGHHQGLRGARYFVEQYIWPATNLTKRWIGTSILYSIHIEPSTGSNIVYQSWLGDFLRGMYTFGSYGPANFAKFMTFVRDVIQEINTRKPGGNTYEAFVETTTGTLGTEAGMFHLPLARYWYTRPEFGGFTFESEMMLAVNAQAWAFLTAFDPKPYYNRPYDTTDHINFNNLKPQVELLYCELKSLLSFPKEVLYEYLVDILGTDPEKFWEPPQYAPGPLARFPPDYHYTDPTFNVTEAAPTQNWQKLWGRVGVWNRTKAWYDTVPNALVRIQGIYGSPARENFVWWEMADENGYFEVWGVSPGAGAASFRINAFVFNQSTGMVIYAPDFGLHMYTPENVVVAYQWITPLVQDIGYTVVFKASSIVLFDAINPATLATPRAAESGGAVAPAGTGGGAEVPGMMVSPGRARAIYTLMVNPYVSESHIAPESYGTFVLQSSKYSFAVAFVPPNEKYEFLLRSPGNLRYPMAVLINASETNPEDEGYLIKPNQQLLLTHTSLHYAKNFYHISDNRFKALSALNPQELQTEQYSLHKKVESLIEETEEAIKSHQYSKAFASSFLAWRLARSVYLYVRPKIEDSATTVPLLSLFLIPFTLLFEKLVLNISGRRKIIALCVIFALTLIAFNYAHPGFRFAASATMIILGISILLLILPVLAIVINQDIQFMRELKIKLSGLHEARVARGAIAVWSFSLGVENMRRRRFRTSLVLVSMICLIVAFVNLASIQRLTIIIAAQTNFTPTYQGVYIHRPMWGEAFPELGELLVNYLTTKYGHVATVAPRAWAYADYSSYTRDRAGWPIFPSGNKSMNVEVIAQALLGLTPQETNVTQVDKLLVKGRWFIPRDRYVCILSETVVEKLNLKLGDTVEIAGLNLTLIGIMSNTLDGINDIDGEGITPLKVNFRQENPYNWHLLISSLKEGVAIIPYDLCLSLGGQVASVSIVPYDPAMVGKISEEIFNFLTDLPIFYCIGEQTWVRTSSIGVSLFGLESQAILWVILFFSILDLMLGNVHERTREIAIYATVGLSPMHVAFMFFAEACAYAVVGGVLGYIVAMVINRIISSALPGTLMLNFGSAQVTYALLISMGSMILSTIYPMYKASRAVVPSLERKWRVPTSPIGDHWSIPFPFFGTMEEEIRGVMAFLYEYARAHMGERPPEFKVTDLKIEVTRAAGVPTYILGMRVRLFPYEAAIVQDVGIIFTSREGRWPMTVELTRVSGTVAEWKKNNMPFLDLLRKQMLVWRGLPQKEKDRYMREFRKLQR